MITEHMDTAALLASARAVASGVELHVSAYAEEFMRRFARPVKRAGGSYSACRGYQPTRFVDVPLSAAELIESIVRECRRSDKPMVVIFRGGDDPGEPAWVRVHEARSFGEALARFARARAEWAQRKAARGWS